MFEMILMFVCGAKSTKKAQEQVEEKAEIEEALNISFHYQSLVLSCPKWNGKI